MFELDEFELFEEDSELEEILDEVELELEELEFELELKLELDELELELLDELELELELLDELELELELLDELELELELLDELDSEDDISLEDELLCKLQPVKQFTEINVKVKSFTIFLCIIKSLPCINILLKK